MSSRVVLKAGIMLQMPWTTVEALTKDGNVPYEGQDSGFIWEAENRIIMCDPSLAVVDFETEYKLTEEEIKSLPYAEGIVNDGVFYVASALIEGSYYNAD